MDVLQGALAIVGDVDAEVGLDASVPCLRQVHHLELALEHLVFELEAEQHVHVVSDLVGFDSDQRRVGPVDRAVEGLLVHVVQRFVEDGLEAWIEIAPEGAAAADQVLPES